VWLCGRERIGSRGNAAVKEGVGGCGFLVGVLFGLRFWCGRHTGVLGWWGVVALWWSRGAGWWCLCVCCVCVCVVWWLVVGGGWGWVFVVWVVLGWWFFGMLFGAGGGCEGATFSVSGSLANLTNIGEKRWGVGNGGNCRRRAHLRFSEGLGR